MSNKTISVSALGICSLLIVSCGAQDDDVEEFPDGDVTLTVPFDPGGGSDVMARLVEQLWDEEFGSGLNFEYRSGAGGTIGMTELATAGSDDGYDIATYNFPHVVTYPAVGLADYSLAEDFEIIGEIAADYNVAVVPDDSSYETFDDFVQAADENPGTLSLSIPQAMDPGHIAYAQIVQDTGIDVPLVAYQTGSDQLDGILSGDTDIAFGAMGTMQSAIDSGDLRVLGVTSEESLEMAPDWPTFQEQGYDVGIHYGRLWLTPAGVDEEIIERYQDGFATIADDPEFQERMANAGFDVEWLDAAEVEDYINDFEQELEDLLPLLDEEDIEEEE